MSSPHDSKAPSEADEAGLGLVHVKTKEECRLGNATIRVWTVELPSKHAEGVLKAIKEKIEGQDDIDLQHLRRFAKPKFLPPHLLAPRDVAKAMHGVARAWETPPPSVMQAPGSTRWEWTLPAKQRAAARPPTLHLLVCPTTLVPLPALHDLLMLEPPFCSSPDSWAYPLEIKEVTVPLLAPTSPQQAQHWSAQYWPTFYRKTNPFGAHPATIAKAELDLHHPAPNNISLDHALSLAERAAGETHRKAFGTRSGCCIIERSDDKTEVIAVAGDARHKPLAATSLNREDYFGQSSCGGGGNPMAHAVMRAIGHVGRKRLRVASQPTVRNAHRAENAFTSVGLARDEPARDAFFLDLPVTDFEHRYFALDNIKPDGYLCLKLEVFLTHEPCVMCSMALVHSRVGRVVFKHRVPATGGLTAEMVSNDTGPVGLGYGLCWRKELNWQFMCWEYDSRSTKHNDDNSSTAGALLANPFSPTEATRKPKRENSLSADDYEYGQLDCIDEAANVSVSSFASVHV